MNGVIFSQWDRAAGVTTTVTRDGDGLYIDNAQPAWFNQMILDECAEMRALAEGIGRAAWEANPLRPIYKAPITLMNRWMVEWDREFRPYMSEAEYIVHKLNSREFQGFKCVPWKLEIPKEHKDKFRWEPKAMMHTGENWQRMAREEGTEAALVAYDREQECFVSWKSLFEGRIPETTQVPVGAGIGSFREEEALAIA